MNSRPPARAKNPSILNTKMSPGKEVGATRIEYSNKGTGQLLKNLKKLLRKPKAFAASIAQHGFKKFQRENDEAYYGVVKIAYGVTLAIDGLQNREAILTELRRLTPDLRAKDTIPIVLRALIDYEGRPGTQRASRDKSVVELLRTRKIKFGRTLKFIRMNNGLHNCAELYRQEMGNRNGAKKDKTEAPKRLSSIFPGVIKRKGSRALVAIRLDSEKPPRFSVSGAVHLDLGEHELTRPWVRAAADKLFDKLVPPKSDDHG